MERALLLVLVLVAAGCLTAPADPGDDAHRTAPTVLTVKSLDDEPHDVTIRLYEAPGTREAPSTNVSRTLAPGEYLSYEREGRTYHVTVSVDGETILDENAPSNVGFVVQITESGTVEVSKAIV